MSKHQRKHTEQAPKEVKEVPVFVKRSVAAFRKLWEEEQQAQWDEIKLVHELRKFL